MLTVVLPSQEPTQNDKTTQQQKPQPAAIPHKQKQYQDSTAIKLPIKGNYHCRSWIRQGMESVLGKVAILNNSFSSGLYFDVVPTLTIQSHC